MLPGAARPICVGDERRMDARMDVRLAVSPSTPDEPPGLDDGSAAAILADEAEDFLNSIGDDVPRRRASAVSARLGRVGGGAPLLCLHAN